jgi:hypothetical protein
MTDFKPGDRITRRAVLGIAPDCGDRPMTALNLTQDAQSLPYGPLALGMPVIADETDQPCTMRVTVIGAFSGMGYPKLYYLFADQQRTCEGFAGEAKRITPLSAFGVGLELDEKGGMFRCVEIAGVRPTARYCDGVPRLWQQLESYRVWWPYRPSVLAMLDRRWLA